MSTVRPRRQPIRWAIVVAGIFCHRSSGSRICGSTASTIELFDARWCFGGASSTIALRTVFLAIARTGICSAR
ncbi:hypothetical protein [Streptomyces sp. 049-1]|uniref:hypothetical protein n=1 Tax=Streptomyces sp. 049-1 TaxID=2789264 RepID=UPI003980A7AD